MPCEQFMSCFILWFYEGGGKLENSPENKNYYVLAFQFSWLINLLFLLTAWNYYENKDKQMCSQKLIASP